MTEPSPVHTMIWDKLKEQSIIAILLAVVTYHFYMRTEKLEAMVSNCQNEFRNTLLQFISKQEGTKFNHSDTFRNESIDNE